MTQQDLADAVGVTRNTIIKIESGRPVEEGIEADVEDKLGYELGSLDDMRAGREPTLKDADTPEDMPHDEWERGLVNEFPHMSRQRRIELFRLHRQTKPPQEPPSEGRETGTGG